jgi:hypothetical protein
MPQRVALFCEGVHQGDGVEADTADDDDGGKDRDGCLFLADEAAVQELAEGPDLGEKEKGDGATDDGVDGVIHGGGSFLPVVYYRQTWWTMEWMF